MSHLTTLQRALLGWSLTFTLSVGADNALPQRFPASVAQSDSMVFEEITKANLLADKKNWGKVYIIDWANRAHEKLQRQGISLTKEQWQLAINEKIVQYNDQAKLLDDPSQMATRGFDYVTLAVKVAGGFSSIVPGTAGVAAAAELGVEITRDQWKIYAGPKAQAKHQTELHSVALHADKVLRTAYSTGKNNSEYRDAFNQTISLDSRAFIGVPALENIKINQAYYIQLGVEKAGEDIGKVLSLLEQGIDANGRLALKLPEIQKISDNLQTNLTKEIQQGTQHIISYFEGKEKTQILAAEAAANRQLRWDAAGSSVFLLSGFMGAIDPTAGRYAQGIGSATIQIASAIGKFQDVLGGAVNPSKILMGSLNLAAGIGMALQGAMSLIFGGPSDTQIILKQLGQISEQILSLHQAMNSHFERIDRNLNNILLGMHHGFLEIKIQLANQSIEIEKIKLALSHLEDQMQRLNLSMYELMVTGFQERIVEHNNICSFENDNISERDFRDCLVSLRTRAVDHSRNALSAGEYTSIFENKVGTAISATAYFALGDALAKGVWNNINTIGRALSTFHSDSALIAIDQNGQIVDLVNPNSWAYYASYFANFLAVHSDYIKYLPDEINRETNLILAEGDRVSTALNRLSSKRDSKEEPPQEHVLLKLLGEIRRTGDAFHTELNYEWKNFQENLVAGRTKTIDLDKPLEEQGDLTSIDWHPQKVVTIDACPTTIKTEGGGYAAKRESLGFPAGFNALMPSEVSLLRYFNPDAIKVCYDELSWVENREEISVNPLYTFPQLNRPGLGQNPPETPASKFAKKVQALPIQPAIVVRGGHYWILATQYEALRAAANEIGVPLESMLFPMESWVYGKLAVKIKVLKINQAAEPDVLTTITVTQREHANTHWFMHAFTTDEGDMEKKFTKDKSQWPTHFGRWVLWVNGNGFPAFNDSGKDNFIEATLNQFWVQGDKSTLLKNTTVARVDNVDNLTKARTSLNDQVSWLRGSFAGQLRQEMESGKMRDKTKSLSVSITLLKNALQMAFPQSSSRNDELYSLLWSQQNVFNPNKIADMLVEKKKFSFAGNPKLYEDEKVAMQRLGELITELVEKQGGKESYDQLRVGRLSLETMKSVSQNLNRGMGLSAALKSFKQAAAAAAGN